MARSTGKGSTASGKRASASKKKAAKKKSVRQATPAKARKKATVSGSKRSAPSGRKRTGPSRGPVMVVTGEHSGDLLGGALVDSLKKKGYRGFFGTGGDHMAAAGVELVEHVAQMEVIGWVEAFKAYRRLKALALKLADMARERGVTHAVLIDYPGFNLRLAEMLKQNNVKVIYLVSPQIWAWNYRRIHTIRRNVELMLTLFPFEKDIYEAEGVRSECVGHPMVEQIPRRLKEQKAIARTKSGRLVGLLPGSRAGEVRRLLPPMLAAAAIVARSHPRLRFLVPGMNPDLESFIAEQIALYPELKVEYVGNRSLRVMEVSDVAAVASGTATLETAFFGTPMVLVYRVSWINFLIGSLVSRTRFLGLVNLLGRKQATVELLQTEVTAQNIADELNRLLDDAPYRQMITEELAYVKRQLGRGAPAARAARAIDDLVRGK